MRLTTFFLVLLGISGYSQTHKYYLDNGIITASQLGSGKYLLAIDTKSGERKLQFRYRAMEADIYVYDLIQVDKETLSEYQRSISYLKTRTKFSDLCAGKGSKAAQAVAGFDCKRATVEGSFGNARQD